jgi:hypothetical protein
MDEIGQAINRQELKIEDAPPSLSGVIMFATIPPFPRGKS